MTASALRKRFIFCCFQRGNQHNPDFATAGIEIFILLLCNHCCILENANPILSFVALFQSNLKLVNKICSAGSVIRLVNIRSYACTATNKLINQSVAFSAFLDQSTNINYADGVFFDNSTSGLFFIIPSKIKD